MPGDPDFDEGRYHPGGLYAPKPWDPGYGQYESGRRLGKAEREERREQLLRNLSVGGGGGGGPCFVATACFEDADHPVVVRLRNFRDTVLLQSTIGRALVDRYSRFGPKAAGAVIRHPSTKPVLKG